MLAIVAIAFPAFQHHDYISEKYYAGPQPVNDSLFDNCFSIDVDEAICNMTNSSNLTRLEIKDLILDSLNPKGSNYDYDFIDEWNNEKKFKKLRPSDVRSYRSGSIRDAWIKIVDIQPSIRSLNQTLLNGTGKIRTEYGFQFVLPYGPARRDCKTYYTAKGYNYSLNTTLNNETISDRKWADFELINVTNIFNSTLSVTSGYTAKHYVWVLDCDDDGDCDETCEYAYTENVTDSLNISDIETGTLYNYTFNASYWVDNNESRMMDYWLFFNASDDFAELKLKSGSSYIRNRNRDYILRYKHEPYNILYYETEKKNITDDVFRGIVLYSNSSVVNSTINKSINTLIKNSQNCKLYLMTHFNKSIYPAFCNATNDTPQLNLTIVNVSNGTAELLISFYDTTNNVSLAGKNITIWHSNSTYNLKTKDDGNATIVIPISDRNRLVKAYFRTDFKTKSADAFAIIPSDIKISDEDVFYVFSSLFMLLFVFSIRKRVIGNE